MGPHRQYLQAAAVLALVCVAAAGGRRVAGHGGGITVKSVIPAVLVGQATESNHPSSFSSGSFGRSNVGFAGSSGFGHGFVSGPAGRTSFNQGFVGNTGFAGASSFGSGAGGFGHAGGANFVPGHVGGASFRSGSVGGGNFGFGQGHPNFVSGANFASGGNFGLGAGQAFSSHGNFRSSNFAPGHSGFGFGSSGSFGAGNNFGHHQGRTHSFGHH
ncbi:ATP-dependent RNA helicase glh-2 [Penaeus vannamei]|uniref:ATP-dependent RNA helicase glh-2 n=1 Tax=Penaeus vannamei TaxID=6689 RepID=UPI00387F3B3F